MTNPDRRVADLRCPSCDQPLQSRDGLVECRNCAATVPVADGIPQFPVAVESTTPSGFFDVLSAIYETPLWFPVLYRVVAGPSAPSDDRVKIAGLLDAAGDDVLDVACGTGRFTRYIATEAAFVWGIDLSDGMVRTARRYAERAGLENVAFARMEATDLRFDAATFEKVACCWALHLFADVPAALTEIKRVLKSGGCFAGATIVEESLLTVPGLRDALQRTVGAHVFDSEQLRSLLRDAGFEAIEFERYGAALFFKAES